MNLAHLNTVLSLACRYERIGRHRQERFLTAIGLLDTFLSFPYRHVGTGRYGNDYQSSLAHLNAFLSLAYRHV